MDDPFDEDVYMAPPVDWRYVEPIDEMEIGKCCVHAHDIHAESHIYTHMGSWFLEDDLLSVMSITLPSSPFYYYDDDPIMIGKCEIWMSFI